MLTHPMMPNSQAGLLSLPSELLYEIIRIWQTWHKRDLCSLRATCKILKEHADPIVFHCLRIPTKDSPHITEHLFIGLATRSSRSCELTKEITVFFLPDGLPASEQSWPHFGHCGDLRVHLPTAISSLRNITSFSWSMNDDEPIWLVNSLMQAVARLPQLTVLDVTTPYLCKIRIPLGLFSNLSKLTVELRSGDFNFFVISQIAIAIASSPQLKTLSVAYERPDFDDLPTLRDFFANLTAQNPLHLEQLHLSSVDATVDQVTVPHLTHLTSFRFALEEADSLIAESVWTSLHDNGIKLSDVAIDDIMTEETMLYLSSFSGLKSLRVGRVATPPDVAQESFRNVLFAEVLPKHVDSLEELNFNDWTFNPTSSKSIMRCLKLRHLRIHIDESMTVQRLLDTVANLPELKTLHVSTPSWSGELDFKPTQGLRYVENLRVDYKRFVLETDGGLPTGYRQT